MTSGATGLASTSSQPPSQQQVNVADDISQWSVRKLTKVAARVWILENTANVRVVIKCEAPMDVAEFVPRREYITWLATGAFPGVPDAAQLTSLELDFLETLGVTEVSNSNPGLSLKDAIDLKNTSQPNFVFYKLTPVEMGANLEARKANGESTSSLRQLVFSEGGLKALGRIAAFDLVVNNRDRFRPPAGRYSRPVNLTNVDFDSANRPLAIDNVDPANPLIHKNLSTDKAWPGGDMVCSLAGRKAYAGLAVQDLLSQLGLEPNGKEDYVAQFLKGMNEGVTALKGLRKALKAKINGETNPDRKQTGQIILDRLKKLYRNQ